MNQFLIYRHTSKTNLKNRPEGFSKRACLENLLSTFSGWKIICVADNCDQDTLSYLSSLHFFRIDEMRLGNAGSFKHIVYNVVPSLSADDIIYIVEDDYLHTSNASSVLLEGLQYFDYVSLYDHPDKYGAFQHGRNPFVLKNSFSEPTQVFKGKTYWRTTNSSTFSFACKVSTFMDDIRFWRYSVSRKNHVEDFKTWLLITKPGYIFRRFKLRWIVLLLTAQIYRLFGFKRKNLGVPLPSRAAHMELVMLPDNFYSDFTEPVPASGNK